MSRPVQSEPMSPLLRFEIIDIVRGFALFGVLIANLSWTAQHFALTAEQRAALPTAELDRAVGALVSFLVTYKFYTLFSMLFGLGFAVQLSRAAARGQDVPRSYLRRLAVLFLVGVAHAVLLWFGDILHIYAVLGFALLLFRRRSDRTVFAWAVGIAAIAMLLPFLHWAVTTMERPAAPEAVTTAVPDHSDSLQTERFDRLTRGGWRGVLEVNWEFNRDDYLGASLEPDGIVHWYLNVLWKFLLGYLIGRRRLLQDAERHGELFRRILPWALLLGLPTNLAWAVAGLLGHHLPDASSALGSLSWVAIEVGILALSIGYLCALVRLHRRPSWHRRLAHLAPVGRMALTNYLSHSLFFVLVFDGVGLGLLGRIGEAACFVLGVGLFSLQVVLSGWWLRRFRFGPAEWAWRSLTYARLQPLRVESPRSA